MNHNAKARHGARRRHEQRQGTDRVEENTVQSGGEEPQIRRGMGDEGDGWEVGRHHDTHDEEHDGRRATRRGD
jgi:hypothetical protein